MIHIVAAENKSRYALWLDEMFAQRKRVFVDELGWALHHEHGRERDAFDTEDALNLLHIDEERGLLKASARLLPSIQPHLLNDVFPDLCEEDVPWGPNIWEASRFCPAPSTPKGDARRHLVSEIIAAIIEAALLFNIERVTFVASAALAPIAKSVGWDVAELGPRIKQRSDRIQAFIAEINAQGLKDVRLRNGLFARLTRFEPAEPSSELASGPRASGQ